MVNARAALYAASQKLKDAQINEALHEARLLFEFAAKCDSRLLSERDFISDEDAELLKQLCIKRAARYPLQYILGKWSFMGLELFVGEGVLIPRFDTETVCIAAAEKCTGLVTPRIFDLCAGSGAISLGIKSLVPDADITAIELYDKAFSYLLQNCGTSINCIKHDIFDYQNKLCDGTIDVLVCNPPYITKEEMIYLEPELSFEPRTALTDEAGGLLFYEHIAKAYKSKIKQGGWLVFEIGYTQAEAVCGICRELGWQNVELRNDLSMNPRAVLACNLT